VLALDRQSPIIALKPSKERNAMSKQTNPDPSPPPGVPVDEANTISTASLTDFIDRMDRAAFRRALELRDTKIVRQAPKAHPLALNQS
jgi:hypothetical protein